MFCGGLMSSSPPAEPHHAVGITVLLFPLLFWVQQGNVVGSPINQGKCKTSLTFQLLIGHFSSSITCHGVELTCTTLLAWLAFFQSRDLHLSDSPAVRTNLQTLFIVLQISGEGKYPIRSINARLSIKLQTLLLPNPLITKLLQNDLLLNQRISFKA